MDGLIWFGFCFVVGVVIGILFGRKNPKKADALAAAAANVGDEAKTVAEKVVQKVKS